MVGTVVLGISKENNVLISKGEKSSYNPVISDYVARISFRKGCLKDSITFEEIVVVLLDRNTNKAVEISAM
jgi:hypothetical protein